MNSNYIMPELFRLFGIRFFFFSNEHLPIHIHIKNSDGDAKFVINPIQLIENHGMKNKDLNLLKALLKKMKS